MTVRERETDQDKPEMGRQCATIVCADIAGYSRIVGENEAFAVETVNHCHEIVSELSKMHQGHVFNTAGDGFMLDFDEADNAMLFSLDLQAHLLERNASLPENLQAWMRIGVSQGEIIKSADQLYGDTVNLAARLQEASSSGGIVISSDVLQELHSPIDLPLLSLGELLLKNIKHPVRAFEIRSVKSNPNALDLVSDEISASSARLFQDRTAIAVLPFDVNASQNDLHYLADGICDDLITALSHVRQFPVISKSSSFAVAKEHSDPRRIAHLLGVRYLVTGLIRRFGKDVRQTIQLIDATTNHILWVEKYILKASEIGEQIDEFVSQIVGSLTTRLEGAESVKARTKRRSKANVHDLVWRARWHFNRLAKEDSAEGKRLLNQALLLEPENPEALIQQAFWHHLDAWKAQKSQAVILNNLRLAHRAIDSDPFDSRGYLAAALAEILLRNFDRALVQCEKALSLNPSYAHAYAEIGTCKLYLSAPEEALGPFETSLKFNPQDYYVFNILAQTAQAHCRIGNWEESLKFARRSSGLKPNFWLAYLCELTSLVRSGELRSAAHVCAKLLRVFPQFSRRTVSWLPFTSDDEIDYFFSSFKEAQSEAERAGLIEAPFQSSGFEIVTQITSV